MLKRSFIGTMKPQDKPDQTLEEVVRGWVDKYPDIMCDEHKASIGWFQYCPQCEQKRQTTCCACGCGNCCYCGFRFCCMPADFNIRIQEVKTYHDNE